MKNIRAKVEVLSPAEIESIHAASLRILEHTGMGMPHRGCLEKCAKAGAVVDYEREIVKIPAGVMADLLRGVRDAATPPSDPSRRSPIQGHISTQVHVVDYATRTRRPGTTDDILKGVALVEHLRNIPYSNAVCVPSDAPAGWTDVAAYLQLYTYSTKPGGTYILSPESGRAILDMAEVMGRKEGYLLETVSPLRFRRETLDMATLFAGRGHYLSIGPMVMGGSTGPVTIAGVVTLTNAEVLGSLFTCAALTGTAPGFYGPGSHSTDPRTLLCSFGSPNQSLLGIAAAQMGAFYGLAAGSNSALSDSLQPDFQAGFEKSSSAIFACLAGTVGIGCQGIAGADQGFSFEQLVLDNEWLDAYNHIIAGFDADTDGIAEDLIRSVGIGGDYLTQEHTVRHVRSSWWSSDLFDRLSWDVYKTRGTADLERRANARVEELTAGYRRREPVQPEDKIRELRRIAGTRA